VHLNTRSHTQNIKRLASFYEKAIEFADDLAEAYQGRHGLIGPITLHSAEKTNNVVEFLRRFAKESRRSAI